MLERSEAKTTENMEIQAKVTKNAESVGEFAEKVNSADSISSLLSALLSAKQKTNDLLTQLVNADRVPIAAEPIGRIKLIEYARI